MNQIHYLQRQILRRLLFNPQLRYTELKPEAKLENNKFDFHLDQLVGMGYVVKQDKFYKLTSGGKEYANRIDTDDSKSKVIIQAKITVSILPMRIRKGKREFVIYTRLKQPFYGCQGFLSGKVFYGETLTKAAARELKEETGLIARPKVFYIRHYLVYEKATRKLVEDKYFNFCIAKNPRGELKGKDEEGRYEWVPEVEIKKYVTNPFETVAELYGFIRRADAQKGDRVFFQEHVHYSSKF
jgi:ADP-ribose pyrophosphatase YjhB (NUDIX family)